jgi:hypothetical protein
MKNFLAIFTIVAAIGCCNVSFAVDEAKSADIRSLMEISGELEILREGMAIFLDRMQSGEANLPDAYYSEFKSALATDELPNLLVKVYDHHFTHEQIRGLIEFYGTPLGKAMIEKMPLIQADALAVGQHWAAETSQEIMARLMPTEGAAGATTSPTE